MATKELQEAIKQQSYAEAMRYMSNAAETLQKAGKENTRYNDSKYVSSACGIAYKGVLVALDAYLALKGVETPRKKRKSIEFYMSNIAQLDGKLLKEVNIVYRILHIEGYYEGILSVPVIKDGFDTASQIISRIKPEHELPPNTQKPSLWQRVYSIFV